MSSNAIERALWQAIRFPRDGERLRNDAASYLNDFMLDDEERELLMSWSVSDMAQRGVSPMLLMMAFTAINGMDRLPEYVERIHQ